MKKYYMLMVIMLGCLGFLTAQNYRVGDVYTAPDGSKGVIFYIFPNGTGGWMVALNDVSANCAWGDATNIAVLDDQEGLYAQLLLEDTSGYANTLAIRNQQNNSSYAAGVVDFANGWYLPSPGQLRVLHAKKPMLDPILEAAGGSPMAHGWYWSSAEKDDGMAWRVDFGNAVYHGRFNSTSKSDLCRVRAVRTFTYEPSYLWSTGDTTATITVAPSQTTNYTVTVSTPVGCADTVEHTIVVNTAVTEEITQSVCDSYEWQGHIYTESGEYTQTFTAANGCDSVMMMLHLTITRTPEVNVMVTADTICAGDSVTLWADAEQQLVFPIAVGSILCTDSSIVSPSEWPVAGKTAMGIVFYVDSTGKHGWAVHLQNQGSYKWASYGTDVVPLPNYSFARVALTDMDGYTNTQIIANNAYCPAVNAVDIAHGWYLPAIGQLNLLFAEMVTMNASLQVVGGTQFSMNSDFHYWSSTECGYNWSWYLQYSGILDYCAKTYNHLVRSVRNF